MLRLRPLAVFLGLALSLCLLGLWAARSQTAVPRRVTNTTAEGINLNPSLSGNGRRIAFESTEDVAGAGGGAFFRAIRADISRTPAAFVQMAGARAPAPGISQDGSIIAFAAKEDPLGTNADGNSEIFLYNGAALRQITNTTPNDISHRATDGNFQPSLSDDGRYIAFSSNRNLTGQNSDGNFEIFVFDATANSFSQLTNTAGGYGATDAKISGNASRVAYIKDSSVLPAVQRDLMLQDRTGGVTRLAADNVTNLSMTLGRAISDDGARVVYAGDTAADSSQVFLYDARTNSARAVTSLGARDTEVPLNATISGDGTRIAFAARRTVPQLGGNGDRSIELYTYDIPTGQFAVVTDAPSQADGFQGSTRVAEVVSSLSDDGSVVAFNFPRTLSDEVATELQNNSEIYVSGTAARPTEGTLEVLNGASFGHEPSTTEAVAPESYAVAFGGALSFETVEAGRLPDGSYPTTLGGTTVTVNNRRAQIVSISPTRVDFLVPAATELGDATVVVTNEEGFRSIGTIDVKTGAPGIFTKSGDGTGEGDIVNAQTRASGPFDPTGGELRLIIFTTGVRNASEVTARAGGHSLIVESVTESADRPGTDEVRVKVPAELRGAGPVDLFVRADDRDSNPVTLTFLGVAPRPDIVINEVLADPPADDDETSAIEGDANRDGVRDTSDDEFVELVNTTARDINIGGYQLFTRGTTAANDTLRHTFAAGTIFPAGSAIVVFGGGNFNPKHPAFGGAQVFKASEGELSLVNTGGVVSLRNADAQLVTIFSYGGSTGLNGGSNQSLTRSPDITGAFTLHTTASGSNGSPYSPGTRVNGQPFTSPAIARIEVAPASANIAIGQTQQFTATAYNAAGNPMSGVIFTWESSNTAVATIDQNGLATGVAEGTTQIRARARGVASAPSTLTVRFVPRVLTGVEVTPSTATIPVSGQQQFTARGLDQFGNAMPGLTFTWESTDTSVATVDQNGLATGVGIGTATIKASTGGKTGTATLNVTTPKIVINEALADPPGSADTDLAGDANHDGERDSSQDEFVELVNSSSASVDISGWTVRTRSLDGTTETLRHTFAASTIIPANSAIVVFGGGNENFDPNSSVFGCAQVVKASSGRLSFLNSGETIVITDASGNLTAQLTYGSAAGLNGGSNQSMTRSPDVTGDFTLHTTAENSGGKAFSPGVKVDGTPFGNCPARLTSVTISPASQSVIIGHNTQFTAQARDQFGRPMKGVTITFTSDKTSVATVESTTTNSTTGIATATVKGRSVGTAHITARATSNGTTVESDPATLNVTPPPPRVTRIEVTPSTAAINRGGTQKFTVKAFNGSTQVASGVSFTWTSSDTNIATVDQNGLATGVGIGTVTITATAPDGLGGTVSDTAQLTVRVPLVINEILADVPTDNEATPAIEGDSNRDGVRSSGDDEFIELLNNTNASVDISGVIIADGTSNRFTIPAGTILAGGRALVIFGGGSPPPDDPAFGGALVIKIPGTLSLNDTGDTVNVKLPVGGTEVVIATQSFGTAGGAAKANDQSLVRSPDAAIGTTGGDFVPHTTATNAAGRVFSPGTRADGTPFGSPAITRIQVTPASATVNVGGTQVFTARAFSNASGTEVEVKNVSFIWDATDPTRATVAPKTGPTTTATARAGGSTMIRAQAGGQAGAGTLNINFPPVSRIEVTPSTATIPVGGAQQFTATAFDANNQVIAGVPFTWSSSNTNVATVDQNGLATGVAVGTTTIKASAGGKSGTATLNVVTRTVTINEVLADPPEGLAGDANRDGVRDSADDEFVELVNALNTSVNIAGWTLRTRSETATTETVRHTFAANATLPANSAIVLFGGGSPNQADPAFGGAQVIKVSTSGLSLTNSGLTIFLRDANGNLVTQFTYGGTNLNAGKDQSLTRSPDITGDFLLHTQAPSSDGRVFSPGTRLDGTPFGSPPITRIQVTPASATVNVGATRVFTARAFSNASGTEVEVFNVSFIWDSSDPSRAAVSPQTGKSTTATALSGGSATIRARAGGQAGAGVLNINFPPVARIEVTPATATIPIGGAQQFTARAFDASNNEITGLTFTWTSSNTAVATIDANGLATGVSEGTVTITASAKGKNGTASLTVVTRTVTINEVLADPPEGLAGDANRDGVRDSGDDEFVELVNALNTSINISGWTLRTRSLTGSTETVRHTFAANTTLPANSGIVLFGGGSPNAADPAFGGSQVLKVSTSGLSLTNTGLHISLRDAGGNLVAQFTYDKAAGLSADKDQSLTRSPDITGDFVLHTTATNADGRVFSPGTRTDGTPFGSPAITRIQVTPATATVNIGGTKTYTARAFSNASGTEVEVFNVSFIWDSSDPSRAAVSPQTGKSTTATALSGGSVVIRARAGGQAGTAALNINFPAVSRIEITPASATIPIGGTQQFTARAFDGSNNEISGLTFTWTSSNTAVATIDANGLATGVSEGTVTITASANGKNGTATLTVVTRTVTINEVLADPPEGLAGDANRDGVRDSADDEFVELVNALNASVNISGWTLRTRSLTGSTETVRHTFDDGTTLPTGKAVVIFGGGSPNQADPAFGGAQVLTASTGRLSLTNSGLTIIVRDASGNLVAQFTYGGTNLNAGKDQSLTRSPDITGDFLLHTQAPSSDGRVFSPGTRLDGTPFGSPAITRIQVTPASATVNVGATRVFTARAFSDTTGTEIEVQNVSFIWDSSDPARATVSPQTGKSTTATALTGGTTTIRARAGGQAGAGTLKVNFPPVSRIEVTPSAATIPIGGTQQFTARAFDTSDNEIAGMTFTWSSSNTNVATVDQNGLATGVGTGTTTIKATAGGKSGTATLNVVARTITINEVLADPPDGLAGDSNRDGVRDSEDDEFVELVNALSTSVSIAGWTVRTRSLSGTSETVRHTFAAGTTMPAGTGFVIFGGGAPNAADPAFGGSQVAKASTGRLSLTNSGLHVIVRSAAGNLVAQFTYGSGAGLNGDANQSLTRSPDITGGFVLHTTATNAAGRTLSPGTRADGTPFGSPPITRIEVTPASASNNVGAKRTFTARAFSNTGGPEVEVQNVSFIWDSSNPNVASLSPQTGKSTTATALSGGSTTIRARAGGQQAAATLTVNFPPVARIEVTPETATIPVGGTQQFTARAFDASNNEISGLTFTWTSSNTNVATVDSNGLATGVGIGTTTIKASAGGKNDTATLTVVARTITINEFLADPPDGLLGDANRDGVRDSTDDEFVELVNALNTAVNISGWTIRTRSLTGSTETVRHTFDDGTTLPAGRAIVVFGGGTLNPSDPAFGGAQVVTTSTSGLSLTNSGLHLVVRDASGNLVAQVTYGSAASLNGDANQSLTRSPDITGAFNLHTTAPNSDGRRFSPGTRLDGTPFGSPAITRIEITPASASVYPGDAQLFTARAYSNAGGPEVEVPNVSFFWDSSNTGVATVSPESGMTTTATAIAPGTTTIRARAGSQADTSTLTVNAVVATVELNPPTASVPATATRTFTATARDGNGNVISGINFTFSLRNPSPANAATIVGTTANTVTVRGDHQGSVTVVASYTRPNDGVTLEDTSALTITAPPPRVTSIDVSPSTATINRGQTQQFTVSAFNGSTPVSGVTYTWTSSDESVATVDQNGLATGVGIGTTTITATAPDGLGGTVSDTATLNVQVPLVINEILADPPTGATGDSNRDGTESSDDDEFLELVNNSNAPVDLSGVVVTDSTSTRFTFAAGTTLAANRAVVIFGGGTPPTTNPNFGGALVLTVADSATSSTSLGLNNTGDTVTVKLSVGGSDVVIATETYGSNAGNDQSLTRSPDLTGAFEHHTTATNADGRRFSPGTRLDGTPFGSPAITRIEVTPASATIDPGQTQGFTAKAFSNTGGPEIEVQNVSFIWESSNTAVATVSPVQDVSTTATATGPGSTNIIAHAGGQAGSATLNVTSPPPVLTSVTISPTSATVGVGGSQQFTAQALDQFNQPIGGVTITFASDNTTVATVDTVSPTSGTGSATATVTGHALGTAHITATANDGSTNVTSPQATLTVEQVANPGDIVISEFRFRGSNGANDEFIELYNRTTSSIPIGGYKIYRSNNAGARTLHATITAGKVIGPGCHYLLTNANATGPYNDAVTGDQTYGTGITDDGGIGFTLPGSDGITGIIDQVGLSNGSAYKEGTFLPNLGTTTASNIDRSYERKPGGAAGSGQDTNDNTADFTLINPSDPQNSLSGCVNTSTADLAITKADSPDPVTTGANVTYTITVTNNGPGVAQSVVVTDNLPANVTFVSCNSTGGGVCGGTGNNRTITFSSLSVGASATITLVATADGAGGTTITNTASVSSATTDPNGANDSATATTTIQPSADLEIPFISGAGGVNVGEEIEISMQLHNDGPNNATNVTVHVDVPAGLEFVSSSQTTGTTYDSNTNNWTIPSIAASTSKSLFITFKVLTAGNKTITAEVSASDQFDPDSTPNNHVSSEDDQKFFIVFVHQADLSLTKTVDNSTPNVGDNVVFTITAHNVGNTATGVQITDLLPTGLSYVSHTVSQGSYVSGTGVWDVGSINNNANATLTITATLTATGTVTNTAEVTDSDVFDPDSTPNNHNAAEDDQASATVTPAPPQVDHVTVSPSTATINRGQTQQFTATAFDSSNQPIPGATFTWTSSNTNVATINSNGLATGVGIGTTTITAETSDGASGTVSGTATLTVQVPLVLNEILADVPPDVVGTTDIVEGDSNRDGVRSADDDEFVELLNNSNAPVDLSGVVIADSTSNRFTFPANTTLAAGRAVIIFGGGTPPTSDPAFGGALIFTTSSLGLNDTGDTVTVKLNVGGTDVVVTQVAYGGANPAPAPSDQSLTRSPDAEVGTTGGSFVAHNTATNAHNRVFSPGTRADGTPFGSPAITRIEVTPATPAIDIGDKQTFTGKAFSNAGGPEVEVPNVSFFWTSSNTPVATVAPLTGQTTEATAHTSGSATITAFAGAQAGTATLTVNAPPPSLSINNVSTTEGDAGTKTYTFTVQLSGPAPTGGVTYDIATADDTATDADNDYEPKSLTAETIPATETSRQFTVTVNGDLNIESDETFFVNVTNVSGATVSDSQGVGTIQNDDSPTLSISDASTTEGNSGTKTYTFTVHLSQPAPAGGVTFDIATQNNTAVVDDGNPATISDNDYVGKSLTSQTIPETAQDYLFTVTVNGDTVVEPDETFFVNVTNVTGATLSDGQGLGTIQNDDTPDLVISQLYPGGGNAGATYTNDFIEIFNQGTTTIDFTVTNYSVQYVGATGTFGSTAAGFKTNIITGTIAPGQYFLIQGASGGANGVALPTPDATGSIAMAATGGKVALVLSTAALPPSTCPGDDTSAPPTNPSGNNIVDFVGYGSGANAPNCFEGSAPAAFSTSTAGGLDPDARSVIRTSSCTDTNNNSADFSNPTTAPTARNKSTPAAPCP